MKKKETSNILKSLIKEIDDESTALLSDDMFKEESENYIDTGSYLLNGLLSTDIFGGVPSNKITTFAGEEATGKTFFTLNILKNFQTQFEDGVSIYNDTEFALSKDIFQKLGIDVDRIILSRPVTIEELRINTIKALTKYIESETKPKMMIILDSLGNISSEKEMAEAEKDSGVKDMTRQAIIKQTFRVIGLKYLAKANVPLIVTNHVYQTIGQYISTKEMSGGCLVAGTKIITDQGYKNIEDINLGDKVLTMQGSYEYVLETHHFKNKELLEIEMEDGSIIRCTPEHKFFVNNKWIEAKFLIKDMNITTMDEI